MPQLLANFIKKQYELHPSLHQVKFYLQFGSGNTMMKESG